MPKRKRKRQPTWQPATEFRVTKLRPAGPKPGQSQESFLRGKAQGDRQWNRIREANFGKLY